MKTLSRAVPLALICVLALSACGGADSTGDKPSANATGNLDASAAHVNACKLYSLAGDDAPKLAVAVTEAVSSAKAVRPLDKRISRLKQVTAAAAGVDGLGKDDAAVFGRLKGALGKVDSATITKTSASAFQQAVVAVRDRCGH